MPAPTYPREALEAALAELLAAQRVVITTHIRPDGDALGSQIGLGLFLRALGKDVTLLNSDPPARNLEWLLDFAEVETWDGSLAQREVLHAADVLVVVDTNSINRVGLLGPAFQSAPGRKLLIDHHLEPETWFDAMLSQSGEAATGLLIYDLITAHDANLIGTGIATALYAAIMTDTGSFRFGGTTPRVHAAVADLLRRGDIRPEPIHVALYDTRRLEAIRLLSMALDTIQTHYDGGLATIEITQSILERSGASSQEAEGFTSYPLSLEGVRAVAMFLETAKGTKISFRSKGDLAVDGWARLFGGGGHRNASGAFVPDKPYRDTVEAVVKAAGRQLGMRPTGASPAADPLTPEDAALLDAFNRS